MTYFPVPVTTAHIALTFIGGYLDQRYVQLLVDSQTRGLHVGSLHRAPRDLWRRHFTRLKLKPQHYLGHHLGHNNII